MKLRTLFCLLLLAPSVAIAAPVVTNTAAGNVGTTSFTLCWETGEAALPGIEIFTDAAGTAEITATVAVEHQYLSGYRREVSSTTDSRATALSLQESMNTRGIFLTRLSGLEPGTTYWARGLAVDGAGTPIDSGPLVEVTTAADTSFIIESRQLVVDFSAAAVVLGTLDGAVVRLINPGSAYPLFSIVNDSLGDNRCYFDLNHLLDAAGEMPLNPGSGTTLSLDLELLGTGPIEGSYSGNEIVFDGSALAASSSLAGFTPEQVNLVASTDYGTALLNQPVLVDLLATDGGGTPIAGFNGSLTLESPAIAGSPLTSAPLVGGRLDDQPVVFTALGNQTVTVTDPGSGVTTTFDVNVLAYNYDNYRMHYYGSINSPEGDPDANGDGDPYNNTFEFAHGLNPHVLNRQLVLGPGGGLLTPGGPLIALQTDGGVQYEATFLRPKNYDLLGIHYNPQFSSALDGWFDNSAPPVVLQDLGDMELVSVPYPFFTPDFRKPRFFRIEVTID